MYYPYFRGKQYELIAIRESAKLMAEAGFVPIIEPVRESLGGLEKALDAVVSAGGKAIVIVNPRHGELSDDGEDITTLLADSFARTPNIIAGILLKPGMTVESIVACCDDHEEHPIALIHTGDTPAKDVARELDDRLEEMTHIFIEPNCTRTYRKHFQTGTRILLKDSFIRRKNSEYPELEKFSDLHATFEMDRMDGFGDFLIVGDEFSESGGPAYAIAIHLTFIDDDDEMWIYHFKSIRQDTPKDPAGKFGEALAALIETVDNDERVEETAAVQEFRELHKRRHFPGLGFVKKLSMQHHIETFAIHFRRA